MDGALATWEQFQQAMILWAARFLALDVETGDVVATILDAGVESLVVWLGLSSVGLMPQRIPSSGAACSHMRSTIASPNYSSLLSSTCRSSTPLPRN